MKTLKLESSDFTLEVFAKTDRSYNRSYNYSQMRLFSRINYCEGGYYINSTMNHVDDYKFKNRNKSLKCEAFVPSNLCSISFEHVLIALERAWWSHLYRHEGYNLSKIHFAFSKELKKRQIYEIVSKKNGGVIVIRYFGEYEIYFTQRGNVITGEIWREGIKLDFVINVVPRNLINK